ncbi:MAG: hypothetical protein AAFV53_27180 [Myxococcota bacterium]
MTHIHEDMMDWAAPRSVTRSAAQIRAAYENRNAYALVPRRTRREQLARQREPGDIVLEMLAFDED